MANKIKLAQVVALDSGERSGVQRTLTDLHQKTQNASLFGGTRRLFTKSTEEGDDLPPEAKKVQLTTDEVLTELRKVLTEWWDHVFTKDSGNAKIPATIEVGDLKIENVPLPTLLWLEDELDKVRKFVDTLPILDPAYSWKYDENEGLFKTEPTQTARTKKTPKVIVKYEATKEHPAQTELVHIDETVGYWENTLLSGAIDGSRKRAILDRVTKLQAAVRMAREEVNSQQIDRREFAKQLFDYIIG